MEFEHSVIIALLLVVIILVFQKTAEHLGVVLPVCFPGSIRGPDGVCRVDLRSGF